MVLRVTSSEGASRRSLLFPRRIFGIQFPQWMQICCSQTRAASNVEMLVRSKTTTAACAWEKQLYTTDRYRSCPAVSQSQRVNALSASQIFFNIVSIPTVALVWVCYLQANLSMRVDLPTDGYPNIIVFTILELFELCPSLININ